MRIRTICLLLSPILSLQTALPQGTVPTFTKTVGPTKWTLGGQSPDQNTTTTIPIVLVPLNLTFESRKTAGKPYEMDAKADVRRLMASPVFTPYVFPTGGKAQYADALLRTTFPSAYNWHTILAKPEIRPITISIPLGYGYILTSKKEGASFAVVDVEYLQNELFKQLPKQDGKLVIALTHNTTYYADRDATVCCSWGTHGVNTTTGNSFVLASYLHDAPSIVKDKDAQPITQQLAEFFLDPLHNPLFHGNRNDPTPGNTVQPWLRPASMPMGDQGPCAGAGIASRYFLLEPSNTNLKNDFPESKPFEARSGPATYHLQNVATVPWYTGPAEGIGTTFSFPDATALPEAAKPCGNRQRGGGGPMIKPTVSPAPRNGPPNGHKLIGYWSGYASAGTATPLRDISPQWDIVIVAFSTPDKNAPEGTMQFHTPAGLDTAQFKADIAWLQSQGKKVVISLGGGGQHFTLADPKRVPNYISSVTKIVSDYGFDGIDIDFESPSLSIDPGDTDFRHPVTPSIVNLIDALRQLHNHFGPKFMMSLVPEGTQIPSGYPSYGGQFGSYLAITYAIKDILSFIDVQDYNTPPLEGLDGEIYQPGTVDYHAAMTELLLHGFNVGGDPAHFFPPLPANRVAVGFLTGDSDPITASQAMDYFITGKAPAGTKYKLHSPNGYPGTIGAMFWTLDADRRNNYSFSNVVGPELHAYPTAK